MTDPGHLGPPEASGHSGLSPCLHEVHCEGGQPVVPLVVPGQHVGQGGQGVLPGAPFQGRAAGIGRAQSCG